MKKGLLGFLLVAVALVTFGISSFAAGTGNLVVHFQAWDGDYSAIGNHGWNGTSVNSTYSGLDDFGAYFEFNDITIEADVDMGFIAPVGDDVLGELCLTKHVLSYQTRDCNYWSYDRNPNSTAYVPFGDGVNYYAGGFNGGSSKTFMKMAETISKNVLADEEKGIVAEWHDESHMNRYAIDNPPDNILPLAYCCPDWKDKLDFEKIQPKILALNKDHQEIRSD